MLLSKAKYRGDKYICNSADMVNSQCFLIIYIFPEFSDIGSQTPKQRQKRHVTGVIL